MAQELTLIEEQTIKSARFAHRLLITICFTALIFGLSPQQDNIYENAVRELNSLLSLDVNQILFDVAFNDKKLKELHKYYSRAESLLSEFGLSLDKSPPQRTLYKIDPWSISISGSSLEDIYNFFTKTSKLSVELTKLDNNLEKDLRAFFRDRKADYEKWGKNVSIGVEKSNFSVSWRRDNRGGSTSTGGTLTHPSEKMMFTAPFHFYSTLNKYEEWRNLVSRTQEAKYFIPNLRLVWNEIREETPNTARAILARKNVPKEKMLVIFGLSIPQNLLSWVIPVLICALSIYFLMHIQNLASMVHSNPKLRKYPWEIFMSDHLAYIVSRGTILLPIVALAVISFATWESQTFSLRLLTVVLFFINVVVIRFVFKSLSLLK